MKTALRSVCVAVVLLAIVPGALAHAKGPTDVVVHGPGVDVTLGYTHRAGDIDLGTLGEATRLYRYMGSHGLKSDPPTAVDRLGPRYEITWLIGTGVIFEQHAYPFAPGGGWVYFLSGDSGWGDGSSGWARAPALEGELVALGAVAEKPGVKAEARPEAEPATVGVRTPTGAEADEDGSGGTSYGVAVSAGLVLAGGLAVGGVVLWRRRLSP